MPRYHFLHLRAELEPKRISPRLFGPTSVPHPHAHDAILITENPLCLQFLSLSAQSVWVGFQSGSHFYWAGELLFNAF